MQINSFLLVISEKHINWDATAPLPLDQEKNHRLHEPEHMIDTIDPITGPDIGDVRGHPSLADGKLTIYFEYEIQGGD